MVGNLGKIYFNGEEGKGERNNEYLRFIKKNMGLITWNKKIKKSAKYNII